MLCLAAKQFSELVPDQSMHKGRTTQQTKKTKQDRMNVDRECRHQSCPIEDQYIVEDIYSLCVDT